MSKLTKNSTDLEIRQEIKVRLETQGYDLGKRFYNTKWYKVLRDQIKAKLSEGDTK